MSETQCIEQFQFFAVGQQQLKLFNGFYDQHKYLPRMLFEGTTGFPLGAWLRHGTSHVGLGAVEMTQRIVERLRQHWPDIMIFVRGDAGVAGPEMYAQIAVMQRTLRNRVRPVPRLKIRADNVKSASFGRKNGTARAFRSLNGSTVDNSEKQKILAQSPGVVRNTR